MSKGKETKLKKPKPKTTRSIRFDVLDLKDADKLDVNISSIARAAVKVEIARKRKLAETADF